MQPKYQKKMGTQRVKKREWTKTGFMFQATKHTHTNWNQ